ncbi:MAG: SMI1/KNR4 family protein, partial [Planctomycetales bacterium]
MESERSWNWLLDNIAVEGEPAPTSDNMLNEYETLNSIKLPQSYRDYCKVFGSGRLTGKIAVQIMTPRNKSVENSIEELNEDIWSRDFIDLDEYCPDPDLIRCGLFFGRDICTHLYFWNKEEPTGIGRNEMAVY